MLAHRVGSLRRPGADIRPFSNSLALTDKALSGFGLHGNGKCMPAGFAYQG
jgi:hypothetical protein